jgi:hypothetical protein
MSKSKYLIVFSGGQDQMGYLFRQLRHWEIDVSRSWKVLTLFIGGNDLCNVCAFDKEIDEEYW